MTLQFKSEGAFDGFHNMAKDLQLLDHAERGIASCRLYGWEGAWVSLGRFQSRDSAIAPGFDKVVTRPTGGKAVLHGHDATVALALPFSGGSVKGAYVWGVEPILKALVLCGADCRLASGFQESSSASPDCFASASPYDLASQKTGRKFAGVAMRITRSAILLQASIPYRQPLIDPEFAMLDPSPIDIADWDWKGFSSALGCVLSEWGATS